MAVKKLKVKVIEEESTELFITTPFIKLDSALKLAGIAGTGGMAKMLIEDGLVRVNGETVLSRGKKVYPGDKINFKNAAFRVEKTDESM